MFSCEGFVGRAFQWSGFSLKFRVFCSFKLGSEPLHFLLFVELNFCVCGLPNLISEDAVSIPVGTKTNYSSHCSPRSLFRSFELLNLKDNGKILFYFFKCKR